MSSMARCRQADRMHSSGPADDVVDGDYREV